jgi:hydrogenase expression/formation protein HypC
MCLAVPGRIIEIADRGKPASMGKVEFAGVLRDVCLGLTPEAAVGDWVIVHAGFALNVLDEDEAQRVLDDLGRLERACREEEPA